jgi:hypothetical protein
VSRYAYLACEPCRVKLWLGKAVFGDDERLRYFHIGSDESEPNSHRLELNRALWKLLADHAGHPLRVVVEGDAAYAELGEYTTVGGDTLDDVPFDDYLRDWPG